MIGTEASADTYFTGNATWGALSAAAKTSALNAATLYLNSRIVWKGSITSVVQPDSWPRQNVVDKEGREIDENTTPLNIEYAAYELALIHSEGNIFSTSVSSTAELIKTRVKAGSVESEEQYAPGTATVTLHGQTAWDNVNALIDGFVAVQSSSLCRS